MNFVVKKTLQYLYNRSQEASTIRNIVMLAGGSVAARYPEQIEYIVPIVMMLVGLVGSFFPDIIGGKKAVDKSVLNTVERNLKIPKIDLVSVRNEEDTVVNHFNPDDIMSNLPKEDRMRTDSGSESGEDGFNSGFGNK
jgi:hypothetical protein